MTIADSRFYDNISSIVRMMREKAGRKRIWVGEDCNGNRILIDLGTIEVVTEIEAGVVEVWSHSGAVKVKASLEEFIELK